MNKKIIGAIASEYFEFVSLSYEQKRQWVMQNPDTVKRIVLSINGIGKKGWIEFISQFGLVEKVTLVNG